MSIEELLKAQDAINVVGNAQSLLNQEYGAQINAHFVVRFNVHPFIDESKQGSKCDLLVSGQQRAADFYANNKDKIRFTSVLVQHNKRNMFNKLNKFASIEIDIIPASVTNKMKSIYPKDRITYEKYYFKDMNKEVKIVNRKVSRSKVQDASIGFIFLYYCWSLGLKNLNLYGFDWKNSISIHTNEQFLGPHNWPFEREKIEEWAKELDWVLHL